MSIYSIPPIVSSSLFLLLGVFILGKNKKSIINVTFFFVCLCTACWQFTWFILFNTENESLVKVLVKIGYAGIILIPVTFFHFFVSFLEKKNKFDRFFLYASYFIAFIFELALFTTNYFISGYYIYFFGFYPKAGPLHLVYLLFLFLILFRILQLLYDFLKRHKEYSALQYNQIKYLMIALIFYAFAASDFLVNYGIEFYPLGFVFILIFLGIIGYTILHYRLMDIRVAARNIFIYTGIAAFSYGIFYFLVWFYNYIFGGVYSFGAYLAGLIIAPLFVFSFYGINKFLIKFANKYLFAGLYSYQSTIDKLSQELNYLNDLDQIIDLIVNTIKQTMRLDRAGILLIDSKQKPIHYQIAKVIGFNEQNGISLVKDNFLTKYLEKNQRPLVKDELALLAKDAETKSDQSGFTKLNEYLGQIEAFLCLPLMSNKQLIGIIVLGAKLAGDAYTKEDLELLTTLSYQAGIAVDNARLYQEVQSFSRTLKQRVDEQTKDIAEKNKYLGELLNMKNDFLRVVNHQLNTPLSIMRNAFAMVKEKVITPEKGFTYSDAGLERMSQTISDFWDAFQMEGEKMAMEKEKTDLEVIIKDLVEEKKKMPLAQKRNLKLEIKKPAFEAPLVWCDPKRIVHVISNLLDNAVFYTEKGGVEVSYELSGQDKLKVKVKDTGVGIAKETVPLLFQKFSRGQSATNLHPDGSGLGLYIAKKIIEGSDGELTVDSAGPGQGATFSFTLPIYAGQKADDKNPAGIKREVVMIIDKTINSGNK